MIEAIVFLFFAYLGWGILKQILRSIPGLLFLAFCFYIAWSSSNPQIGYDIEQVTNFLSKVPGYITDMANTIAHEVN